DVQEFTLAPADNFFRRKMAVVLDQGVGLGDDESLLAVGGEIIEVGADFAVLDLAVRRFEEAEVIHLGKGCQGSNEADVRAFGSFDWANPAIVRRMHVADFESGTVAGETAWS